MTDLRVRVVWAEPKHQFVRDLALAPGATVADAIRCAAIEAGAGFDHVGIFGRLVDLSTPLRDGDRVELYRPLKIDPKEARRRRAAKQGSPAD